MPTGFIVSPFNVRTLAQAALRLLPARKPLHNGLCNVGTTTQQPVGYARLSLKTDYVEGTEFVPTAVLGPIAVPGYFDVTNSQIFFGGAGNVTFDNLRVVAYNPKS